MDGINGMNIESSKVYQNATDEKTIKNKDYSNATSEELMDACKEFETYFVEQMYKSMEKMVPKNEEESSSEYLDTFKDKLTQEYAKSTSDGDGIGIAQMLFEQMKRNYNIEEK